VNAAAGPLLAHRVHGARGPWVLLLHGIGGGQGIWSDAASGTASALAAAGYRAVTADLPGYGASAHLPPSDMAGMAQQVLALADALAARDGDAPLVLLGHSMGGMVAQEFAALHPQRAAALVLACTSAAFGPPGGDWQARFVAERLAPLNAGLGMAGMAAALVPPMLGPQARPEASALAQAVMAAVPEATYRAVLQAIVRFDRREALPRITVPVLLLAGAHDPTAPAALMQRMAARLPAGAFAAVPGAGHIANVERPQPFNDAVASFLQRTVPTA
jgi:pimeloyl-ACP methyl ester carboxylesterase